MLTKRLLWLSMRDKVRIAVVATICVSVGLTGTAEAAGSRSRDACRKLRGHDLAPARTIKLVRHKTADGNKLLGCALPRGRVYKVASASDLETTVYGYKLKQVAGAFVLVRGSYSSQYGSSSSTYVASVRTGRSYTIAAQESSLGDAPCDPTMQACGPSDEAIAVAAVINRRGQAAALISQYGVADWFVAGFSSKGKRQDLDRGPQADLPAQSLRLTGSVVTWLHAGAPRSATLTD